MNQETREEFLKRALDALRNEQVNLEIDSDTFAPCIMFEGEKIFLEPMQDAQTMGSNKE